MNRYVDVYRLAGWVTIQLVCVLPLNLSRCDSNPAQYERNRRFGQLAHTVARASNAVKLPSVGL